MADRTILVVDDSPTELALAKSVLQARGFRILTAIDGEDALARVEAEKPDLILLDVIMPKKNGFQVCRQLKTTPATKDIKVVLVTSKKQDADRFWGLKQGADEYLIKPYREEDLLAAVARQI
jgi:twitching motility two-component system response regulator PilH